ncbi:MAG TPA: DASS family sodium-coupled anion symporter [Gammaproteobacteria bacterium]|nr:DASS family sodium-coupled anion symporter [Gammaproteobacteria bacterium]
MRTRASAIGLWGGVVLSVLVYLLVPAEMVDAQGAASQLSPAGRIVLALMCLMAAWWIFEAIPIYVTALLPLLLLPVTGVQSFAETAVSYGHPIIFLAFSGFAIAAALEKWHVHRRIAIAIVSVAGQSPRRLIAALMLASALLSMWISNTATAILMLPVALSLIDSHDADAGASPNFAPCLLLAICYSCSMGGMTTLTGTTTNMFFAGYLDSELGRPVSFAAWMGFSGPIAVVMLAAIWFLLTFVLFPLRRARLGSGAAQMLEQQSVNEPWTSGGLRTASVFVCVALCWFALPLLERVPGLQALDMYIVGTAGVLALFVVRSKGRDGEPLLDWGTARGRIPWGILLLIGGGLSLAAAFSRFGVSEFLALQVAELNQLPLAVVFLVVVALMVFLTEVTTNVASLTALTPVFASVAVSLRIEPAVVIALLAVAASCAFMLPVATPPNAIVFGSERIRIGQMARAGICFNVLAIVVITTWGYFFAETFFGD